MTKDFANSPRLSAALADRYRIERELGQGGMATVYLAHDIRHERDVAIKVLHPDLGAALGADRFLSEIKTTAKLQHPHILPLLDSGVADGLLYYVMPLVTGETLRARLARETQLPISDALRIAREVADALGYAHSLGIIHRDIKPENILLQGVHALVADFGIALAVQQAGASRMTQTGLSLGTPQYMSPEQAMGERTIDARSDIYSLGAVTYEMLTGDAPFTGSSVQAVIAKVLTERPTAPRAVRDTIPPGVEHAVLMSLAKLPADRFLNAEEFGDALGNTSFVSAAVADAGSMHRPVLALVQRRWLLMSLVISALFIVSTVALLLRPAAAAITSRQQITLWQHRFQPSLAAGVANPRVQAVIAPDASSIVFIDSTAGGFVVMRKTLDAIAGTPIAGTLGAVSVFLAPDGKWIGYITADGQLRKVPMTGGGSITLATDASRVGSLATWMDDGRILYKSEGPGIHVIAAERGTATVVKGTLNLGNPASLSSLPGSRGFLLTRCGGNCALGSAVYLFDLAADSSRLLVTGAAGAWYSPTGHLLYTSVDGGLYAASFDLGRMSLSSGSVPVVDGVEPTSFSLSTTGTVLYTLDAAAGLKPELEWVRRDGTTEPFDSTWRENFEYPTLSPDGSQLAVSARGQRTDLWIRSADGGRRKVEAGERGNWRASWMPRGDSLTFISVPSGVSRAEAPEAFEVSATDLAAPRRIFAHAYGVWEVELSRDGEWLLFRADEQNSVGHVYARRRTGDTAVRALLVDPVNDALAVALSPDSRWLAYVAVDDKKSEIYIASFPDMRTRRLVSRGNGSEPRWAHSGRELFFKSNGHMMVVDVPQGSISAMGNPRTLFPVGNYRSAVNRQQYDVSVDDQRFLMIRDRTGARGKEAVYVEGWFTELLAKVGR